MRIANEETLISTPSFRGLDTFQGENLARTDAALPARIDADLERDQADEHDRPTLLSLVEAVREVTDDDREVVATVAHLIRSGRVRFSGHFQDMSPPAVFS